MPAAGKGRKTGKVNNDLHWTLNIVDLVELTFALQEVGAFNGGELYTKYLMALLSELFQLEMGDCFAHYMSIRGRSGSRTKFLDKLKRSLEKKMDQDEENIRKRR